MGLSEDFKEFIKLLNEKGVKYLIVGGYAVAYYGNPRYTKDIDLWIWPNENNAEKMVETLKDFGFSSLGLTKSDFFNPDNIIQLGYPPNRIDLITDLTGVDFEVCFANRQEVEMDELKINFISLDDLIANKIKTGRHQDLADVQKLNKKKKG